MTSSLDALLGEVRGCQVCSDLPLGPRPVLQVGAGARIVLIGQAPGTRVHASGVPWDDPSGDHLREWLGVDRNTFYDPDWFAILPMGFCYPGKKKGGDKPPRSECALLWHARLLEALPAERLVVLIGQYAQAYYLGPRRCKSLTATVRAWRDYLPDALPLPHPSWRSKLWMQKNPWFAEEVLPELRARITARVPRVDGGPLR